MVSHVFCPLHVVGKERVERWGNFNTIREADGAADNTLLHLPNDTAVRNCLGTVMLISVSIISDS